MRVPEGGEREKESESLFKERIAKNFPNLGKDMSIQIHEAHRSPNKFNPNRSSQRHIIIKVSKIKDKVSILKAATEKKLVTYHLQGNLHKATTRYRSRNLAGQKQWDDIFKVLQIKNCQPIILNWKSYSS